MSSLCSRRSLESRSKRRLTCTHGIVQRSGFLLSRDATAETHEAAVACSAADKGEVGRLLFLGMSFLKLCLLLLVTRTA
jgi:hypothetical protein